MEYISKGGEVSRGINQMEGIRPYLDFLSQQDIAMLWRVCCENGWIEWRKEHLDVRLRNAGIRFFNDAAAKAELDREVSNDESYFFVDHWGKDFLATGISLDHMMSVVRDWLSCNEVSKALSIAAEIVTRFGKRSHLEILKVHSEANSDFGKILIKNTNFSLQLRSIR